MNKSQTHAEFYEYTENTNVNVNKIIGADTKHGKDDRIIIVIIRIATVYIHAELH